MDEHEDLYWDCQGFPFDADLELRRFVSKQVEWALINAFDNELTVWLDADGGKPQINVSGPEDPRTRNGLVDTLHKLFDLEEVILSIAVMNPEGIRATVDLLERVSRKLRDTE